ncbi:MAG: S9 family peptidase [Ignavibacteriaceae bacterium]|nr:MAG: S9 family peptidase [Ignavibacteriaceae bacterium]MBW7872633.1 S9 family peptidase [Ignavibacteria bacterium]OQY75609.1 MAG: oligopeptidase B [Ignavibacteriales bacterium UTCHB3]
MLKSQRDYPAPPSAKKIPTVFTEFGKTRVDDYYWLRDKSNPEVIDYLNKENAYAETVMESTKDLQETLYEEMKGRIKEEDQGVPVYENGYWYYYRTETGKQYPIYCRKQGTLETPEEILFDVNKMAEGHATFLFTGYQVSDNNRYALYSSNTTGSYAEDDLRVRDLTTGEDLPFLATGVQSYQWAGDDRTVFFVIGSESLRPYLLKRADVFKNDPPADVYEEKDELFNLYISRTLTKEYLVLGSGSFTSSESRILKSDDPYGEFKVFIPREKDVEYSIDHHPSGWFITVKDDNSKNSKVYRAPLQGYEDKSKWQEFIPHDPKVKIEYIAVYQKFVAVQERSEGLRRIRTISLDGAKSGFLTFPEEVYALSMGVSPEFTSDAFRYSYTSLNRPYTTYEYNAITGETKKLKEQEIPSGFNPDDYTVERMWATAPDGKKVPMAIVYKKGLKKDGNNPTLLYSYGSYGASTEAGFNSNVFSLVNRGYIYGIAQIRGGSELGEEWYDDGKLLNKKNTFTDFIACAEHLVKNGYTNPQKLAIMGGSAGGLLVGACMNMRPDLFRVVLGIVPFVDVINTMLDESLPLTTQEWEQWGNPNEKEYYDYMISYSPYDNIKAVNYPNILLTGGLNDSQVGFHEPAKFAAKLRATKTDDNLLILKINMESGHGGASGRFARLKEVAFQYAFILGSIK